MWVFVVQTFPDVPVATKIVEPRLTLVLNVALSSLTPAAGPNVQLPRVAIPLASVTCVAPVILPPPAVTLNTTCTPAAGCPLRSATWTAGATGRVVLTGWVCPSPR